MESALAYAMTGDTAKAESIAKELNKTLSAGHPGAVAVAISHSGAISPEQKGPSRPIKICKALTSPLELAKFHSSPIFPASILPTFVGRLSLRREKAGRRCGIPQGSRSQRHRMELLDGSAGTLRTRPCIRARSSDQRTVPTLTLPAPKRAGVLRGSSDLWKDAEPDIPLFKEAKAENAKLR